MRAVTVIVSGYIFDPLSRREIDKSGFSSGGVDTFDLGRSMAGNECGGEKVAISFFFDDSKSRPSRFERNARGGKGVSVVEKSVCVIGPSLTSRIRQIDPTFELCSINRRGGVKRVPLQRCKSILSISSYLIPDRIDLCQKDLPLTVIKFLSKYRLMMFIPSQKKKERKGNIFNEFQSNGSILFERFVKKEKLFSRNYFSLLRRGGESFFTLIRVGGSTPSKGAGDTEGSFKILLLPGGIPDKSSR